ncbi:DUF4097 family beta strand repeat-containing protein [Actinomycetes bacterium KLBMP 9797]
MPTFDTPEPITAELDLVVAEVRVTADDRRDTVVDVRPSDPSDAADVRAGEQTRVEYTAGRLLVKTPSQKRLGLFGKPGSIRVTVALPAGSHLRGEASVGALHCTGPLGECRVKISAGDVYVERAAAADLTSGAGAVSADVVAGDAELSTGSGRIRVRQIGGTARIKNSNGDTWVGEVAGDLRASAANGHIRVDRAHGSVNATSANGDLHAGDLVRGTTSLRTSAGEIEIGIHSGTAARLDVSTKFGRVENQLAATDRPEPSDETLDVRASTSFGDIVIRRAA